jgi:hypothetical protein
MLGVVHCTLYSSRCNYYSMYNKSFSTVELLVKCKNELAIEFNKETAYTFSTQFRLPRTRINGRR